MATIKRFKDLICWQRARELTRLVYEQFQNYKFKSLNDQIQRAAVSIMSNIAEGFERGTKQEFLNYLFIAKGSAGEVRAQLYVALDCGYLNLETFKHSDNQKAPTIKPRLFDVDPTGLAPASSRVKGDILLHKTTGPDPREEI